jgi:beta-glucosidase
MSKGKLFGILAAVFLILGILMNQVGGYYNTVLTVAMEGSTVDWDLQEETYAAGIAMNVELEEEGIVLLKNEENVLPLASGTAKVNVFGDHAVNLVYNGSGSGSSSQEGAMDLKTGLESAGLQVNEDLWNLIEGNTTSGDTDVHEGNEVDTSNYPINELPVTSYTGDCSFDNLKSFSDIALVVIGRLGGEGQDLPRTGYGVDGTGHYLQLSTEEQELLAALEQNGFTTIVLINSSYAMELGFLEQRAYGVDAALWIGGPGQNGTSAVGSVLTGKTVPSGRLVDTYAYDLTTQSTYKTSDYYYYWLEGDDSESLAGFSNYAEGIYVGYRWYETADAEGYWSNVSNEFGSGYDGVVQYPFGYGLSYTTFEQSIENADLESGILTLSVKVKNTGSTYEGKEVVQVYAETPYFNGGTEKSKVVLAAFTKTDVIAPGAETTVELTINMEDLASYDETADGGSGAYVLDAGEYSFYLSDNAHSWASIDVDDSTHCYSTQQEEVVYSGENKRSSDAVAASNQFAEASGGIESLSRADGFANAEETIFSDIEDITVKESDDLYAMLKTNATKAGEFQGEIGDTTTGATGTLTLSDMLGLDYDDEKWDQLISQMSVDDMMTLIGTGGWSTAEITSIDKQKTTDIDGPFGLSNYIQNEMGNSQAACVSYCSEVVVASTWNRELVQRYGETVGNEANATGVSGWYAPGANLHRSSFSGRNPEYYSEDPYLSGVMCASTVEGAFSKGLYTYIKHFAFNDQEANRTNKENCWMTEQTAREIYLKPFENAIKNGDASGLMVSYMWFEGQWCGGNYNLMTNVVRNEWDFKGMVITDNYCSGWMNATKAIMAGTDLILSNSLREVNEDVVGTDEGIAAMKQACKHILYTIVNASNQRSVSASSGFNWWKLTYYSVQVIFFGLAVVFVVLAFLQHRKHGKKNAITVEKVEK